MKLTFPLSQEPSLIYRGFVSLVFYLCGDSVLFLVNGSFLYRIDLEVVRWIIKFELFVVWT